MRRALLTFLLALLATPAFAGTAGFDIQLGTEPPAPKPVDPAKITAVERFLAARQDGSRDAKQRGEARALVTEKVKDEELFGPAGATMIAYDFHDRAIEPGESGSFRVRVYLLFCGGEGSVVGSRDETLTFRARDGGYACSSMMTTGSMDWDQTGVADSADRLQGGDALAEAEGALSAWTRQQQGGAAWSVADIEKLAEGRFRVQCLRFTASRGKRGFDAKDSALILVRDGEGFRVDSN